jgi:atypical dual specificity phosphatase
MTAPLRYSTLGSGLLAGRMPHATMHVVALRAEGVKTVINLCEDHEYWAGEREAVEAAYAAAGIAEHRLGVPDGATIPPDVLDRAVAATAGGETAYVHCRGGRERSAAVAVALLATRSGVGIDEALSAAAARWPTCRPLPWQLAGVRAWAGSGGA